MRQPPRNPYQPPRPPKRSGRSGTTQRRPFLWWVLLAAPFLFFLLAVELARMLGEQGAPSSDGVRESLIQAAGAWASGSVKAAFMVPSAWLLERLVHRLGTDTSRFRHLALKLSVVSIYTLGAAEMLAYRGSLPRDHAVQMGIRILNGLGIVAAVPLLLAWTTVALVERRRGG